MASSSGGNYFQILDPDPSPKRKKNNDFNINNSFDFPKFIQKQNSNSKKQQSPKYIVIKSKINDKPLQNFNIFLLSKALESISSEPLQKITFTRDGNLLILTRNETQANKFLKTTTLSGLIPVEISLHTTLNITKGVIFCPSLKELSEKEITDGLRDQGVVECKKITKYNDGKTENTPLHILHFNQFSLPREIKIGFLNCKVEPFIPTPIQCKNCFKLGHTKKYCNGNESCEICSSTTHEPSPCTKIECVNCKHPHRSNNKKCPVIQQRQEILRIKTINNCTYREATTKAPPVETFEIPSEDLQTAIEEKKKRINRQQSKNQNNNTITPTITNTSTSTETIITTTSNSTPSNSTAIKSLEEILIKSKAFKSSTHNKCKTNIAQNTQLTNSITKKSPNSQKSNSKENSNLGTEKNITNSDNPCKISYRRHAIDSEDEMEL